ncbi:MAG: YggU family protein [Desulfobulbaceae bacterium]|nr:YggU family protein [Desulfobulbaceae bacterium]
MPYLLTQADGSLLLRIHVQPRASQNQVTGLQGDALKIRLSAPPVDGKANKAVLAFLAGLLSLPKSALSLKSGQQSRQKTVLVTGINEASIRSILAPLVQ